MSRTHTAQLAIQPLEDRRTPAVFGVAGLADANFAGTLRWAVNQANLLAGPDVIDCTKVAGVINLKLGELPIVEAVTVIGPGAAVLTINGGGASRIFNTQKAPAGSLIAFSDLTMASGKSASVGGAIGGDDEAIVLRGCVLNGNMAATRGGGVSLALGGSLVATDTRFIGNIANTLGGAIDVGGIGATTSLTRCTVSNNYAPTGAGLHAERSLTVQDSTINWNKAAASGGGVHFLGTAGTAANLLTFRNSTVSGNACPGVGGGVALENFVGAFDVYNSTFAFNSAGAKGGAIGVMSGGGVINLDSCILQNDSAPVGPEISAPEVRYHATALFNPAGIGALVNLGLNLLFTDCKLGPLANNGGKTYTHRLNAGSPAINAGANPLLLASDQRGGGFTRTAMGKTDMGAYERQAILIPPVVTGFTINDGSAQRSMISSLTVTFSEAVSFPNGKYNAVSLKWLPPSGPVDVPIEITMGQDGSEMYVHWKLLTTLPVDPSGSLTDGNYRLTIDAAEVMGAEELLDGNGDGTPGGNYDTGFYRLFGDLDGDGDVDASDFGAMRAAFGSDDPLFDFDGDGDVDASDYGVFRRNFGAGL